MTQKLKAGFKKETQHSLLLLRNPIETKSLSGGVFWLMDLPWRKYVFVVKVFYRARNVLNINLLKPIFKKPFGNTETC